jgi:hypothetical protein
MVGSNEIGDRLEGAADTVPKDRSALLIEAADEIRHLRDLLPVDDETWLEGVKLNGTQWRSAAGIPCEPTHWMPLPSPPPALVRP